MTWLFVDKLVPVPSLFFIGKNGTPLEVVTGITKTVEELESKIATVLERAELAIGEETSTAASQAAAPATGSSSQETNSTRVDDGSEVVCEGGVCYKKTNEQQPATNSASDESKSSQPQVADEAKLRRAKELMEKKRIEKEDANARVRR